MFGILRWQVQLIIVWSQIVHQAFNCTRLDYLQNWHHLQTVLDNVSANTVQLCKGVLIKPVRSFVIRGAAL